MTDKNKSFLTHAVVYGLGMFLIQGVSVILLPLYTSYLTPAEFGVLEILNRIGEVVVICLTVNGIRMAILTFFCQAHDEREREQIAITVGLFLLTIIAGCAVLVCCFAGLLAPLVGIENPRLLMFGVVTVLIEAVAIMPLAFMQARVQSVQYVCTTLAMCVCRIGLAIIAVAVLGWGIWGVLASSAVTSGVFGGVLTLRECLKGSLRPDLSKLVEVARFAAPFIPGGLCFFVLNSGDRFFLVRSVSADEIGLYALGYKLAVAVGMFSATPLHMVWGARMYKVFEEPDAPRTIGRVYTRILAVYLLVGLGLCACKSELIALLGSAEYAGATAIVGPVVLGYYFFALVSLLDSAFYVCRRTALKPWIAFVATVLILALYALLIPRYGAMGAAYATVGGFFCYAVVTFVVAQRVFPIRLEIGRIAGMLVLAIAAAVMAEWMGTGPMALVGKFALVCAWAMSLWLTGLISDDEKAYAVDRIRWVGSLLRKTRPEKQWETHV